MKLVRWSCACIAVVGAVSGCGGGSNGSSSTASQASSSSSSQASSGSAAAPGGATTIAGAEFKFTPSTDTVSKGTKITFKNAGHVPHDLKLSQGGKVVAGTKLIQAGQSASFTVNLPPGTYTMFCSVPGHEQAGMKGTITVK